MTKTKNTQTVSFDDLKEGMIFSTDVINRVDPRYGEFIEMRLTEVRIEGDSGYATVMGVDVTGELDHMGYVRKYGIGIRVGADFEILR